MLLTLYDQYGSVKATLSPNDTSTQDKEIQGDNVLSLSFTLYEYVGIDVNDYVDFEGERYWAVEKYLPNEKSTVEWEYNVKLYGIESLIKRFLVLKTVDGANEAVFTLTARPIEHMRLIVQNINDGMDHTTNFKVGTVDGTDNVVIDYTGKYCDEGLKELAEQVGVEWWIEGETVNLCRCEHGEKLTLAYGAGLASLDRDVADNAKFYTRLFPIGSSRNIDPERYGASRLQLPGGVKYVDVNADRYGVIHHYEQEAFSGIYPRRVGVVSSVRSENVQDSDGNPFTIWYFKDESLTFDPNDYEIGGLVKHVSFQEGSELAGLGVDDGHYFEVNYNSETGEFEIVTIWPYDDDTQLPGGTLIPKVGDRYILWNIRMPDEYYGLAEQEFLSAVNEYNAQHALDVSRYKAPTDHVWIEDEGMELYIGRRVRLESREYFPETGYRSSRITRISRQVTLPSQMDLEISDALSTRTLEKIDDAISDVKNYTGTLVGSVNVPDIIRSWDTTPATDNNLYSARRSQKEFVSKNRNDKAKGHITFEKGVTFGQEENATIDDKGNAKLVSLIVKTLLRSPEFRNGFTGEGWKIWLEDGLAKMELDELTVRRVMHVFEMIIDRIRSVGGQIVVSAANGKIKTVEDTGDSYRIYFDGDNYYQPHDLMRCKTFTGDVRGYWVEILSATAEYVVVSKSEFEAGVQPMEGDECVLMGNTEDALRQNLILISATEDGQPRISVMDGVKEKNFEGCLRARLGNLDGISDDWFPADNQPHGDGLYADNAYLRGTFLLETGEDVKTRFEIIEGRVTSLVEALRNDYNEDGNCLSNAAWSDGLEKWDTEAGAVFFLLGSRWVWANDGLLSEHGDGAYVMMDGGRKVVRLRNKYIRQRLENMRHVPVFSADGEGRKRAVSVYLSFFYRCVKPGKMRIEFSDVDKDGFEAFESMSVEEELGATEGYVQYTCDGLWNGTGDFSLSFTGEMMLYMLVLSEDKVDSLAYKYRTLFEQSERLVKIAAENFDKDGKVLESSGIMTTAKYNELMSEKFNEDGSLKNSAGMVTTTDFNTYVSSLSTQLDDEFSKYVKTEAFAGMFAAAADESENIVKRADMAVYVKRGEDGRLESGVRIAGDQIDMAGKVNVNGNFKILLDGSIEANNAKIKGYIYTVFKRLSESGATELGFNSKTQNDEYLLNSNLYVNATYNGVVLPADEKYEGARVIVVDSNFKKTRTMHPPTTVRTSDGKKILSGMFRQKYSEDDPDAFNMYEADVLTIDSGSVELVLQHVPMSIAEDGAVTEWQYQWILINSSCQTLFWSLDGKEYQYYYNIHS